MKTHLSADVVDGGRTLAPARSGCGSGNGAGAGWGLKGPGRRTFGGIKGQQDKVGFTAQAPVQSHLHHDGFTINGHGRPMCRNKALIGVGPRGV